MELVKYSNFWLIWLGCAGSKEGISLFKIQEYWKIKTNYLYHKERSLEKPLVKAMIDEGYIKDGEKGLVANFDWIPSYVLNEHKLKSNDKWSLNSFIVENIPDIHKFIEKNKIQLFDKELIKDLYRDDINTLKREGYSIFDYIILFIFTSNLIPFCRQYGADIVVRMIYTVFSFSSRKDFLGYFNKLNKTIPKDKIPIVIKNEGDLVNTLCPFDILNEGQQDYNG